LLAVELAPEAPGLAVAAAAAGLAGAAAGLAGAAGAGFFAGVWARTLPELRESRAARDVAASESRRAAGERRSSMVILLGCF
jgi:hypothetical protein